MFSRVASSSAVSALRGASRSSLPRLAAAAYNSSSSRRAFSSASASAPAATSTEEENKPQKGIFEEYGVFPVASFITAWMISTEVIIIDPEMILAGMEIVMFGTILNAAREPAAAYFKKYDEQETAYVATLIAFSLFSHSCFC
jgi:hypothetical protein